MKKLFSIVMLFSALMGFFACSNANYVANPSSNANTSFNPLNHSPSYNWTGTGPLSAVINGASWIADSVTWQTDTHQYNIINGSVGGKKFMSILLNGVYPGNSYTMGATNGSQFIEFIDSVSVPARLTYNSLIAPFGTGGIKIIRNDTLAPGVHGYIEALFFAQCTDSIGRVVSITNGYFNIQKW